jgi:hypothetical protein
MLKFYLIVNLCFPIAFQWGTLIIDVRVSNEISYWKMNGKMAKSEFVLKYSRFSSRCLLC